MRWQFVAPITNGRGLTASCFLRTHNPLVQIRISLLSVAFNQLRRIVKARTGRHLALYNVKVGVEQ
jgi:hypothetical protein